MTEKQEGQVVRSEEHTSELQTRYHISYDDLVV